MPLLEWQDKFNLGIAPFDAHHQHLVMLLNTAYDNFVSGIPAETAGPMLDELVDYATYHFNAEESWMKENGYAKFDEHLEMHNRFTRRITEMQKDFVNDRHNVPLEILTFLAGWLSTHILSADAEYKQVADKGAQIEL